MILPGVRLPSPVTEVYDDRLAAGGVRLLLKRDDLIHPEVPGNKWRKLRYNLDEAARRGHATVLTYGGAYSHHLRATAIACRHLGFASVGVVRGEPHPPLNPVLADAVANGMTLTYLDRAAYRAKTDPVAVAALRRRFGDAYVIAEGGGNALGVRGCAELPAELPRGVDVVCCASGTGTTLAGIAAGLAPGRQRAIGFAVLRGGEFLTGEVTRLQRAYGRQTSNWSVETEFHFGGYARRTPALDDFVTDFRHRHDVTLDRVYEAKALYGLIALVDRGRFPPGTTVAAVIA